ncbi:MAG: PASTA domain-containing protein [Firmicutes bacterium]|nr:PASTA domain-containing protein [Bacillota bacterium]
MVPQEQQPSASRGWIRFTAGVLIGLYGLLTMRLGYWQLLRGPELAAQAAASRTRTISQSALRGSILDRSGRVLAQSRMAKTVWADPQQVRNPEAVADRLSAVLGIPAPRIRELLSGPGQFVYIKRKVTDAEAAQVQALIDQGQVPGVYLMDEPQRVYPNGALAAHVLGFTGIEDQGLAGLEAYYDHLLRPQPGKVQVETTPDGSPVEPGQVVPERPGADLHTSIDLTIQSIVEAELERTVRESQALRGGVIVMDVDTGEILAMAAYPDFSPDNYGSDPTLWRNWLVTDPISPGSIFKPLTAAAALEEGIVDLNTEFVDEAGYIEVQGVKLWNWNRMGTGRGTLATLLEQSSNVGFARLALELGAERFYRWMDIFNLTRRTGIDLPGEAVGTRPAHPTDLDLATMGFGQTATETPVQMLAAINAIANSGRWVQPHLVRAVVDPTTGETREFRPVTRPVISPETARELWALLESVVSRGTAQGARVEGYRVAGKTGTATKYDAAGREIQGRYIASFVGFAPADRPEITVLILLDEPRAERMTMGGQVAAPLFGRIMGKILIHLGIPPTSGSPAEGGKGPAADGNLPGQVPVPALTLRPVDRAKAELERSGLVPAVEGSGPVVTDQEPPPGTPLAPGSQVVLRAAPLPADGPVPVPDLTGLTLREAGDLLSALGLEVAAQGGGAVVRQDPAPGTRLPRGSRVAIWLDRASVGP